MNRRLRRILLLAGLLTLPLALSACGVKGPLMPPQSSGITDQGEEDEQPGRPTAQQPGPGSGNPMAGNAGSPAVVNAPNATRRSPLDWLLN